MKLYEQSTCSFIVKVWLEDKDEQLDDGHWLGHITHVPTYERHYLKSFEEIVAFMVPFLQAMGAHIEDTSAKN